MRSSLSRNVCRQLLACHGLSAPASALSASSHASLRSTRPRRALVRHPSRRTFINNLLKKPPREVQNAGFEPGFGTFVEFRAHSIEGLKLPEREELVSAFRAFFDYKLNHRKPMNPTQAFCARLVLEHLQLDRTHEPALTTKDLANALTVLNIPLRKEKTGNLAKFASAVYDEIRRAKFPSGKASNNERYTELCSEEMERYISVLTRHGASGDAARVLSDYKDLTSRFNLSRPNQFSTLHMLVLRGFTRERNTAVKKYAEDLEAAGFAYYPELHEIMTIFYAGLGEDEEKELRRWFEKPVAGGKMARPEAYMALVKFSAKAESQPEWVKRSLQELCDTNPPKAWWDVVLKWAVYQGKDIGQIKHMINVIAELNAKDESVRADIFTINGLIGAAIENKNALLVERINALASEMGLRPTARTYSLLLQARIAGQDASGAASAFEDVVHSGPLYPGSDTIDILNQYIRYLCSGTTEFKRIVEVLSLVERQGGELDPETVVAACLNFLKNDKSLEVIDTLGLHLKQFSMEDRQVVQEDLRKYCLDKQVSTARAWDCYNLLRQFFPEISRAERVQLMQGLFDRKRADMATQIFGHMRAHPDDDIRPDLEAYVACLEGLGAYPDLESLQMVHNMFKMDTKIQPNTKLFNAFMIAYTGCGEPRKAFDFWLQIANSSEGPTYASLGLVFRTCQSLPYGYEKAKAIWDKMNRLEVDVPLDVYDAFTLMMAGQGQLDDVKNLLISRHTDYGVEPAWTL